MVTYKSNCILDIKLNIITITPINMYNLHIFVKHFKKSKYGVSSPILLHTNYLANGEMK